MEVAHDSIFGGRLGIKNTKDLIQTNFYWPGMQGNVISFCRSYDVGQKSTAKGSAPCVLLGDMPLIERFNGTLKKMLRRLCNEQPCQWHRFVKPLLFAYREAPQEATGFSPFELLYGKKVRGPVQILKELWTGDTDGTEIKTSYQYVFELRERLYNTMKIAQKELLKSRKKNKTLYGKGAKRRELQEGDKVLLLLPTDTDKLL